MALKIKKKIAKPISYGGKRPLKTVVAIPIHYTGNKGDTAIGNANYFATSNTRDAGAHFFVDKSGDIVKSVNMNRIAWSVGGKYSIANGAGKYYGKYTNANTVSIELCDCLTCTNWKQMVATRKLVNYIKKKCPNANNIVRHWDVNGKDCPAPMTGKNNKKWKELHDFLVGDCEFTAKVTIKAALRKSAKLVRTNVTGFITKGSTVEIDKLVGNWCRIKDSKDSKGKYRWISINKIKKI